MRVFTEPVFKSSDSLIQDLKNKSFNYPRITQLYIPVIGINAKKYPNFSNYDDWLLVPYFAWIWRSTDEECGEQFRACLIHTETRLQKIYDSMGADAFGIMCRDLAKSAKHPAVDGVHRKILDFDAELKAMEYYLGKGFSVARIPTGQPKTPDFSAEKEDEFIKVEVKLIHCSNPLKDYISRYMGFLGSFRDYTFNFGMATGRSFSYKETVSDYLQGDFNEVKKLIHDCLKDDSKPKEIELTRPSVTEIKYIREEEVPLGLVTIDDQVSFCIEQLAIFLNSYVVRRKEQAKTKFDEDNKKYCVYLRIQLDEELHLPYDEFLKPKRKAIEDFLRRQAEIESIEIILDCGGVPIELKP